jgi:hypothetical protein
MDQAHVRKLLLADYASYVSILDQKGVAFEPAYTDEELANLPIPDLKILVGHVRDLSRTPTGGR